MSAASLGRQMPPLYLLIKDMYLQMRTGLSNRTGAASSRPVPARGSERGPSRRPPSGASQYITCTAKPGQGPPRESPCSGSSNPIIAELTVIASVRDTLTWSGGMKTSTVRGGEETRQEALAAGEGKVHLFHPVNIS
ncbi:unnamed protein product [Gadus morhua 'NCC']